LRAETPFRLRACKAIDREWREIAVRFKTVFKAWANDEAPLAEYPAVRHRSTESGRSGVGGNLFGLLDLAQSLGHPGEATHPEVKRAVADCKRRINEAGKRVREDFMRFAWINDVLRAGMRTLLSAEADTPIRHSS